MGWMKVPGVTLARCRVLWDGLFKRATDSGATVSAPALTATSCAPLRSLARLTQAPPLVTRTPAHAWLVRYAARRTLAAQCAQRCASNRAPWFARTRLFGFTAHAFVGFSLMSTDLEHGQNQGFAPLFELVQNEFGVKAKTIAADDVDYCDEVVSFHESAAESENARLEIEEMPTPPVQLDCPVVLSEARSNVVNINFTTERMNFTITLDIAVASQVHAVVAAIESASDDDDDDDYTSSSSNTDGDGKLDDGGNEKRQLELVSATESFEIIEDALEDDEGLNQSMAAFDNISWHPYPRIYKQGDKLEPEKKFQSFGSDVAAVAENSLSLDEPEREFLYGRDDVDISPPPERVMTYYPLPSSNDAATAESITRILDGSEGENLWLLLEEIFGK